MVTILDIDEMTVLAQARAEQWEQDFQAEFREPELVMQGVMAHLQMTEEEREENRQRDPVMHDKIMRAIRRSPLGKMTGGSYA